MRFATIPAFIFFGFLSCAPVARADCANTQNAFDDVYCNIQVFHQADHQLNMDYGALAKTLNPAEKDSLKHAEIVWIKDRNDQCTQSQDGWDFVAMDCAVDMTNKRDAFLQKITRDCASTGCVDSDIAKESDN
jgi:uncharacterized protein YecT (DUF1311 family)